MPLYSNADAQPRSFSGLVDAVDGSGVTLAAGEVVDIDRPVEDRFLTAFSGSAVDARKLLALDTVPGPATPAPDEVPAPSTPETVAEAKADVAAAVEDLAAAEAATSTATPSPTTPAAPASTPGV